jgi:chromosome partitioning protein
MPQTMRVLVFASQKGGSGKTTLAGHIGVMAELAGAGPVALIDTDPQGSLAKWWNCREAPQPAFIHSAFNNLVHDLDQARDQGFKLVVIDTPPAVTKAISEVVAFADLVVLPTRPSPHDLRAVGPTIDIVEARKKQMVFALNCAAARAKITSEAAVALSQHGTVAPAIVHSRTDFAASMIDGRTVMEADPDGKSADEIRALWAYLAGRLAKLDGVEDRDPALSHLIQTVPKNVNGLGREAPLFGRRAAYS